MQREREEQTRVDTIFDFGKREKLRLSLFWEGHTERLTEFLRAVLLVVRGH